MSTEGSLRRYVALLRAINVGGNSLIKMAELRSLVESLGFADVSTYIQTGNVIFSSSETDRKKLARRLEEAVASSFGHDTTVFVLTPRQLKQASAANPFDPQRRDQEQRCHLVFLSGKPSAARTKELMALEGEEYSFAVRGSVLYYAYSRELDGSRRRNVDFEKVLGVRGTSRTWKVVDKLIELTD